VGVGEGKEVRDLYLVVLKTLVTIFAAEEIARNGTGVGDGRVNHLLPNLTHAAAQNTGEVGIGVR
jgi:hypothetical protein